MLSPCCGSTIGCQGWGSGHCHCGFGCHLQGCDRLRGKSTDSGAYSAFQEYGVLDAASTVEASPVAAGPAIGIVDVVAAVTGIFGWNIAAIISGTCIDFVTLWGPGGTVDLGSL